MLNNKEYQATMTHRLLMIFSFLTLSCEAQIDNHIEDSSKISFLDTILISYEPINISMANSEYNDYNSYVGFLLTMNHLLIFSTNRNFFQSIRYCC